MLMSGSRSSTGREFQTDGPATKKARRPHALSRCRGTSRRWRLEDRRRCRVEQKRQTLCLVLSASTPICFFRCTCIRESVCACVFAYSEILLDILPTIQTPEVAKVLIDLIRDESISGIRSRLSIAAMSLTVKPTPEVVKSLLVRATWHLAPVACTLHK